MMICGVVAMCSVVACSDRQPIDSKEVPTKLLTLSANDMFHGVEGPSALHSMDISANGETVVAALLSGAARTWRITKAGLTPLADFVPEPNDGAARYCTGLAISADAPLVALGFNITTKASKNGKGRGRIVLWNFQTHLQRSF